MASPVWLRDVTDSDLPIFFAQQLDPDATRMAVFPARNHEAFLAHWAKILADETVAVQTIISDGRVAGNIGSWVYLDERHVCYWLGKEYWGQGIASAALVLFLERVQQRPLVARVAKSNSASLRVLQKCGFVISGEDRFPLADGGYGDEYILTLSSPKQADNG